MECIGYVEVFDATKKNKLVEKIENVIEFTENEHSYTIISKGKKRPNKIIYSKPEFEVRAGFKQETT